MAIYFMAMYLCGASFGPLLTGKLSDLMARRAAEAAGAARVTEAFKAVGLQQAMFIIPVLSLLLGDRPLLRIANRSRRHAPKEAAGASAYAD